MAESTTRSTTTLTGTIPGSVNVTGEEMAGLSLSEGRDTDTTTLAIPGMYTIDNMHCCWRILFII